MRRYAIYYAPRPEEPIARFASMWLGRDPETGDAVPRLAIPPQILDRIDAITSEPRRYGFHGTLKPPFALASGVTESEVLSHIRLFAAARKPVRIGRLVFGEMGSFLALVPLQTPTALVELAADCVREFDRYRAPALPEELARRRASGLSPRQDELLTRWGYPYVFNEFRFHLTLTNAITDIEFRTQVRLALADLIVSFADEPMQALDLVVFMQDDVETPFRVLARIPLGGA